MTENAFSVKHSLISYSSLDCFLKYLYPAIIKGKQVVTAISIIAALQNTEQ